MVVIVLLAAYGVYVGSFVPGMLVAPVAPVLPAAYIVQTILAFTAGKMQVSSRESSLNVRFIRGDAG